MFAEPDSAVNLIGASDTAAAMVENQPKVQAALKPAEALPGATSWLHVLRRRAAVPHGLDRGAKAHGLANLHFEVGRAQDFDGSDLDLITCFDCLHDMGDPKAAASHIRKALKDGDG